MNDLLSTTRITGATSIEVEELPSLNLVGIVYSEATTGDIQPVAHRFDTIGGVDRAFIDAVGGADVVPFDLVGGPDALPFSTLGSTQRSAGDAVGGSDSMSFDVVGGRRL
jgi:hypothetical protein